MNPTQQAACSSLVAGLAAGAVFYYRSGNPHELLSMPLLASGIFFLTLANALWAIGKAEDRVSSLERPIAMLETHTGTTLASGESD